MYGMSAVKEEEITNLMERLRKEHSSLNIPMAVLHMCVCVPVLCLMYLRSVCSKSLIHCRFSQSSVVVCGECYRVN